MKAVYFNQNGMWVYAGLVKKDYKIDDIIRLKRVHYPLQVIKIDGADSRYESVIYCKLIGVNQHNGHSTRLEYSDKQEILLRITEIEAILENNLRDDPDEIKELEKELEKLRNLSSNWTDEEKEKIWSK